VSLQGDFQLGFDFLGDLPIVVEPSRGELTSDAGLLPIRQFDEQIGLTWAMAAALEDSRDPLRVEHDFTEMFRSRVYGILAGYEDQNDHDRLRFDPVFKLIADRRPDEAALASQPTYSRFENQVTIADLRRLREAMLEQFLASFADAPHRLTIDLDAVDDPAHGEQQLALFHGYYDQHQYLPLLISNAETGQFVLLSLRPGNAAAALGADDDLRYLVTRVRQRWPDVQILVRGDCGFGVPSLYRVCEELGVTFTFGIGSNAKLKKMTEGLLTEAEARYAATKEPQRLFAVFPYRAHTWEHTRCVVAKVECHAGGSNRRFVVSNRPGAPICPEACYDDYVQRGEAENRNKEIKVGLGMDRLSDHRFVANFFRLYLHATAHNLLARMRRHVAAPPLPAEAVVTAADGAANLPEELPAEALTGKQRQRYFRLRRQYDLFGHAQPDTWRMQLIKVAAEIITSTRRVLVRLAANWPFLHLYRRVSLAVVPSATVTPTG
jgi:hypothetical protein